MLAAACAPAYVKASSLMRVVVPSQAIWLPPSKGNQLITLSQLTAEILEAFERGLASSNVVDTDFQDGLSKQRVLTIKRPTKYLTL